MRLRDRNRAIVFTERAVTIAWVCMQPRTQRSCFCRGFFQRLLIADACDGRLVPQASIFGPDRLLSSRAHSIDLDVFASTDREQGSQNFWADVRREELD